MPALRRLLLVLLYILRRAEETPIMEKWLNSCLAWATAWGGLAQRLDGSHGNVFVYAPARRRLCRIVVVVVVVFAPVCVVIAAVVAVVLRMCRICHQEF